jgi:hypothetical protein
MEMVMKAQAATMNPFPRTAMIPLMIPTADDLAAFLMAR